MIPWNQSHTHTQCTRTHDAHAHMCIHHMHAHAHECHVHTCVCTHMDMQCAYTYLHTQMHPTCTHTNMHTHVHTHFTGRHGLIFPLISGAQGPPVSTFLILPFPSRNPVEPNHSAGAQKAAASPMHTGLKGESQASQIPPSVASSC